MSDLLGSQDIFYPTNFGGLKPNASFSTSLSTSAPVKVFGVMNFMCSSTLLASAQMHCVPLTG